MKKFLFIFVPMVINAGNGTTFEPLLKFGFGTRTAALGGAYVGYANDIEAIWWNNAGLNQMDHYEVMLTHHEWFGGIRDEYVSFVWPYTIDATISTGLDLTTCGGIEHWDENNYPITKDSILSIYSMIYVLGYSHRLFDARFNVGINGKFMFENYYISNVMAFAGDISFHYKPVKLFGLGLQFSNLGYSINGDALPMFIQGGVDIQLFDFMHLLTDTRYDILDGEISLHSGLESKINNMLDLRIGYQTGPQTVIGQEETQSLGIISGFTAGIGVYFKSYRFDYNISPFGELGTVQRLELVHSFGERPKKGNITIYVKDKETKEPVSAILNLRGRVKGQFRLNKNGTFARKSLNPGEIKIDVSKEDYYPAEDKISVVAGKTQTKTIFISKIPPGSFEGNVFDAKTKEPVKAHIVINTDTINTTDKGSFAKKGLRRGKYHIKVIPFNQKYFNQEVDIEIKAGKTLKRDFPLRREKEVIILHSIHFETAKADILPDSYKVLDEIGTILKENPQIVMEIGGHTDARPIKTKEYNNNMELSQARAESVKKYLVEKFNISPDRLVAKGYGATKPIADNKTEEGMAKNRRTEFKILRGIKYYHEIKEE